MPGAHASTVRQMTGEVAVDCPVVQLVIICASRAWRPSGQGKTRLSRPLGSPLVVRDLLKSLDVSTLGVFAHQEIGATQWTNLTPLLVLSWSHCGPCCIAILPLRQFPFMSPPWESLPNKRSASPPILPSLTTSPSSGILTVFFSGTNLG
jgi:hypothetical protein